MIDFPASPNAGDTFVAPNGTAWIFDGVKWTGTGNPWSSVRYRNRIINGDMSVDQRNGGNVVAQPATGAYAIDRWKFMNVNSVASKGNLGQIATTFVLGFQYCLNWQTTTVYTVVAADLFAYWQGIEGYNFNDAQWGTANAQPVVLEFWAYSGVAGTYAGAIKNGAANRSYVFTYTLPAAMWTKVRLTIPGDTAGTWAVAANALAAFVQFTIDAGTTYQTASANAWVAGSFNTVAGAVSRLAQTGTFNITGVALMVGAAAQNAEPEFRKYSDNLIDCMRYFYKPDGTIVTGAYAAGAGLGLQVHRTYPVIMRGLPTVSGQSFAGSANVGAATSALTTSMARWAASTSASGNSASSISGELYDADF
jgi:hypothetical protein